MIQNRFIRGLAGTTMVLVVIAIWGHGALRYYLLLYYQNLTEDRRERQALCHEVPERCLANLVIGRAIAESATSIRVLDRIDASAYRNDEEITLWGLEAEDNQIREIYAQAAINTLLAEAGPWVGCWQRNRNQHTCIMLGQETPDDLPLYSRDRDLARQLLANGLGRYVIDDQSLPMPEYTHQAPAGALYLAGDYLNTARAAGVQIVGAQP
ncbi:MAG: hypothetical protein AAF556_00090 [Pseudomonadota bacterium]